MKTFLTSAAVIMLGLSAHAIAVAGDGHGRSGHQSNAVNHAVNHKTNFSPVGTGTGKNGTGNLTGTNGTSMGPGKNGTGMTGNGSGKNGMGYSKHTPFKDYKGTCYYGKNCNFWSNSCYNNSYGCYTYWCPRSTCWFYWCQPYGCYLPVDYCPTGCYVY